jgi:cytoskeletal protein RodZ
MAPTKRSTKSDAAPAVKVEEIAADIKTTAIAKKKDAVAKVAEAVPEAESGTLPSVTQFPLTVALSFALSTLGSMIVSQVSKGELESLTRSQDTWGEVAILAAWKM